MTLDEAGAEGVVRRWVDLWSTGDLAAADRVFSHDVLDLLGILHQLGRAMSPVPL